MPHLSRHASITCSHTFIQACNFLRPHHDGGNSRFKPLDCREFTRQSWGAAICSHPSYAFHDFSTCGVWLAGFPVLLSSNSLALFFAPAVASFSFL
jgi:hypothetical protein